MDVVGHEPWHRTDSEGWALTELGEEGPGKRLYEEADALGAAAADLRRCRRDWIAMQCTNGHEHVMPFLCRRALACSSCAKAEARRLRERYLPRVRRALEAAPDGVRERHMVCPLRVREGEDYGDAFDRLQTAVKLLCRLCWGLPRGAREWRLYEQLFPLTSRELARVPKLTATGRPRSEQTVQREAWTRRRRGIERSRTRKASGGLIALEAGESNGNPHAHVLVIGRYVQHAKLVEAWRLVTGDSFILFIGAKAGVREVAKYVTKFSKAPPALVAELYRAMIGRRRIEAWGVLRTVDDDERLVLTIGQFCPDCGEPMKPVGTVPDTLYRRGIRAPPKSRDLKLPGWQRFRCRMD